MLSPSNPVLFFSEVLLYEDELSDRGSSKSHVRFRIMGDCWFVLLRSYLRLDMVAVRVLDTRVFHKFGSDTLERDFSWREETWQNLANKGFEFGSEWLLSPYQSDEVYELLEQKMFKQD